MEETAEAIDTLIQVFGDQIHTDEFWSKFRILVVGRATDGETVN